ncbi:MAG TPA: hypothetical protein DEF89_17270 [Desulfosporosinus sp.]|nr:hypothetical protein [Desulfosporosinus sp.]
MVTNLTYTQAHILLGIPKKEGDRWLTLTMI